MISPLTENDRECVRSAVENSDSELRAAVKDELLGRVDTSFTDEIEQLLEEQCHVPIFWD